MNTGIGDAVNLAWKLAGVLQGRADAALLDSYEPERIAFARRLVATTDRVFGCDEFQGVRPAGAVENRSVFSAALFQVSVGTTLHVPRDFTGGGELSWKQLERRPRGLCSRRGPSAVGEDGIERVRGQLRSAEFAGLAGSCLRRSLGRNQNFLRRPKIAAIHFLMAPGNSERACGVMSSICCDRTAILQW